MADVATPQPGLVSALPTMLMSYFTGQPTDKTASLNDSLDVNTKRHSQNNYTIELIPTTPAMQEDTPRSQRSNPNRNSLPLMLHDEDDYASREGSLMSSNGGRNKKRSCRPKTSYSIAHAPPKGSARHKIHVRAKPLLQLHQLSQSARPMPAYELLPSAIFSPSLSRAIAKTFRTRHGLCPADLAIVKAEKYHQHEDSTKEEDESRDVLALVCKGRKGDGNAVSKAKLYLEDGSEWEAYPLPNGSYEFFSTDHHGLGMTARWVLRRPKARRSQSASDMAASWSADGSAQKRFQFSTISPNSRRHPVIASLTTTSLEINDTYTIPSPLAPSPEVSDHEHEDAGQDSTNASAEPKVTTSSLKALITATAIWVTLREGWCSGYRYDDLMLRSPSLKLNTPPIKSPTESSLAATAKEDTPRRSGSIARMFRSAGAKRRSTSSAQLDGSTSTEEVPIARSASARRARADSTSTVLVHSKRPRGRRADTTSTTASGLAHMDLARNDMTEEEDSVETTAAMLAKSSKRASAPTPLIPALDVQESDEENHTLRSDSAHILETEKKLAAAAVERQKRESSTTSTNSMYAGKVEADMSPKAKKSRFRKLFCGMAG
ncbi:hypothetical protein AUEXF2481DRAFT_39120 [Aureobasidium subglaciale EXF-2481]|uniref:Uncharacterized protein n=1 Tax=Aureobasidium subglaciale (strain EXF-2481) TaxID=1043005 RepID=A0A074YE09_AURSE|nr:uncharacterized protein AUEXF2481DRAFT_39120 [Aureobasidium subglaciale EXF-2481]KEQ96033.1 hypothetical protein AUEXF2481DRAFT_39120 [Aureobasidium subglaciale EXF-2481]